MSPHSNIIQDDGMRPAPRRVRRFARRSGPCAAGVAVVAATALLGCGIESSADAASASAKAPASAPVVRFAVKGDWGWGGPEQRRVTARLCAEHRIHPFRFLLTTGDNFYQPDGVANSANFTVPERCVTRLGLRWRAAWGNHDLGGDSTATVLGSRRRWFTFVSGPVRVVVLDSNDPENATQLRFLRRVLKVARQRVVIVAYHHPTYTMGLHEPSTAQQRLWAPLFRKAGVSLVLQGHNHAYERMVVRGVTYITTGGGGAPLYPCVRTAPGAKACLPDHHFLNVTVAARRIRVDAVTPTGRRLERVLVPIRRPLR